MRKQYHAVDAFKFFCAFLIIVLHTSPFLSYSKIINFGFRQIITTIAVPCFFIISGFLFAEKMQQLSVIDKKTYIKKYLGRIATIYAIWSVIYLGFNIRQWITEGFRSEFLLYYVRDFFFEGSYATIWFLPALFFSILIVYLLHKKLSYKSMLFISGFIYIFTLLGTSYYDISLKIPFLARFYDSYYTVFETMKNGVFFGFIFVNLGGILAEYKDSIKITQKKNIILIGIFWAFLAGEQFIRQFFSESKSCDTVIMLIPLCFLLCYLFISLELKNHSVYSKLRKYSMCMFLCQRIPMSIIDIWFSDSVIYTNSIAYFLIVFIATMLISTIIIQGSKKVKILKYLY